MTQYTTLPPVELVKVTIETSLGSTYEFPDMTRSAVERLIKDNISFQGDLTLANVSGAVMVIPTRIIKTLAVNGEVKWSGIAFVHEL